MPRGRGAGCGLRTPRDYKPHDAARGAGGGDARGGSVPRRVPFSRLGRRHVGLKEDDGGRARGSERGALRAAAARPGRELAGEGRRR